jgi:predicted nucleic acid-binding protein
MSAVCFVDTNLLVYFRDATEAGKQAIAARWLSALWRSRSGRVSFQVLSEYYVTVTQHLHPGLPREEARMDIRSLLAWRPVGMDRLLVEGAWGLQDRYRFSWWDALVVAAAQRANCRYLLSEDLQPEQQVGSVVIIDPFQRSIEEVLGDET